MALVVDNIRAYGKFCIGCQDSNTDIMITYQDESGEIIDVFIDTARAERLVEEIQSRLLDNKSRKIEY